MLKVFAAPSKQLRQRVTRTEEDPRINNLRVNNNRHKDTHQLRPTLNRKTGNSTYTRAPKPTKYQRGSLDNVSNLNVDGNQPQEPLSLRRCRSLALTEEDVFNSLEIRYDDRPSRRPQLIPRARLVDRNPRDQR
ncbi:hypothetical protein WA026_001066 [Henosepilachna vigintioctopunctata]|uniref:Uncharacterized protein n=1 Tax=Henosepilachna vigintioctopunctata TaxID=420089 RepID=A0AAW1V964_9CUCU